MHVLLITYTSASNARVSISPSTGAAAIGVLARLVNADATLGCHMIVWEVDGFPGSWRGGGKGCAKRDEIDVPFHG